MVVLLTACVLAALLAMQAVSMKHRRDSEEKVLKGYFLLGLSGLMAKLAMADGRVTGDEAELADTFFRKMAVTEAERALLLGNFITARRDGLELHDHVKRFLAFANPVTSEFLYDLLWRISRADGVVDPAEDKLLKEIALYLGLGESAYEFFRDGKSRKYERAALKACGVPDSLLSLT